MVSTRIRTAAAALVLAAGLVVSGCASTPPTPTPEATSPSAQSPSAEPQTQAQQCARLVAEVQGIAADVPRVGELLGTDPFGALALVGSISSRVGDLDLQITDPELLERIERIQADWDALVQEAQDALGAGDVAAFERIGASLSALGQQVSDLQQLCAAS